MIQKPYIFIIFLVGCFCYDGAYAQAKDWTTKFSKDERVEVKYQIQNQHDEAGKKVQVVEYESTMISNQITQEQCIALMNNVNLHKDFLQDTQQSERLSDISENEWLVYYYINAIWPLPDSDCVAKVIYERESDIKVSFTSISTPNAHEKKEVERMILNDAKYSFEQLTNSEVKITIWVKFQPVVNVPKWILNTWFPNGPAEMMYKLEQVAQQL